MPGLHPSLIDEGTAFKEILEDVRYRLAVEYLKSGHLTIQEIAYTLGYTASPTSAGRSSAVKVFRLRRTGRARTGALEAGNVFGRFGWRTWSIIRGYPGAAGRQGRCDDTRGRAAGLLQSRSTRFFHRKWL